MTGCASPGTNQLAMVAEDLRKARSVSVEVEGAMGRMALPGKVLAALRKCLPNLELVEGGPADIEISWHDDSGPELCIDYWEPKCDAQVAIATVSDHFFEVHWARSRPNKCTQTEDCLFKLFLKDLQAAACGARK